MINQKAFIAIVKDLLVGEKIQTIEKASITEFKIGKNYLYKVNDNKLINIQKRFHNYFQENIPLNNSAVAFRKNLSYLHLFEPHRKNYYFLRLDIRSFFHSIEVDDIKDVFKEYISEDEYIDKNQKQTLLDAFIYIVTYKIPKDSSNKKEFRGKQTLPMGFLTSPTISNIIFRQLDIQIQKLCSLKKIEYTRYADDMLFSSEKDLSYVHSDGFIKEIRIIIGQMSFKLNEHKTVKATHTLSLNGYTIQYDEMFFDNMENIPIRYKIKDEYVTKKLYELRLSNKKTNIIKKMIHMILKEKKAPNIILKKLFNYKLKFECDKESYEKYNTEQLLHKVLGYRSYLLSIIQFNKKYQCAQEDTITKYVQIINNLEEIGKNYQVKLEKLEKIVEKKRKSLNNMSNISIDDLSLSLSLKNKLKEAKFKTLKDFYGVHESDLVDIVKGVGKVNAKSIMEIIHNTLNKY